MRSLSVILLVALTNLATGALGCSPATQPSSAASVDPGDDDAIALRSPSEPGPLFRFRAVDGREVSGEAVSGKLSVLLFVATFDLASQAQARFLAGVHRHHRPQIACQAIAVEGPEATPLVKTFAQALDLPCPIAHVTPDRLAASPLRRISTVPSVMVMNRSGQVIWEHAGLVPQEVLDEVITKAELLGR